jgi:hypothetical protein
MLSHVEVDGGWVPYTLAGAGMTSGFVLKPDWEGPPARADAVDVNLGHSPESFVRAAYGQITGREAPDEVVARWAGRLCNGGHVRRVDVVRALAAEHERRIELVYSDPWRAHPELVGAPVRRAKRDVGAVFMFFFDCPGGVNCGMDWANTHALGMNRPHSLYGRANGERGIYSACEPGFWRREMLDAEYAGLQFLLLNVYGPDIEGRKLDPLTKALAMLDAPIDLALFDDTWTWGKPYFDAFWRQKPNLASPRVADLLYEAKWRPFYERIDDRRWYRFAGRPFIYFYNGGTLTPREHSAAVIARMKARFRADFGEEPFVAVDDAFLADPDMPEVADSTFKWMTLDLPEKRSRSRLKGHVLDHAMVKWDSIGRDRPGEMASEADRVLKDSALLERVLDDSSDADVLVLATWNDLGEGTGIHRNYDYYAGGRWLEPDHFMRLIRESQSRSHER